MILGRRCLWEATGIRPLYLRNFSVPLHWWSQSACEEHIVPCVGHGTRKKKEKKKNLCVCAPSRKVKADCTGVVLVQYLAASFGNRYQHASVGRPEEFQRKGGTYGLRGSGFLGWLGGGLAVSARPLPANRTLRSIALVNELRRRAHNQSFPSIVRPRITNSVPNLCSGNLLSQSSVVGGVTLLQGL